MIDLCDMIDEDMLVLCALRLTSPWVIEKNNYFFAGRNGREEKI